MFDHRDVNIVSFSNKGKIYFIINIYSDNCQSALKYFRDIEVNISNILIFTGDFNIRDCIWDPLFLYQSNNTNIIWEIADSFGLKLSIPYTQVPTRYVDNSHILDSVIDLMFLRPNSCKFNTYTILPELRRPFDHTLLWIIIKIYKKNFSTNIRTIFKDRKEEKAYISKLLTLFKNVQSNILSDIHILEKTVDTIAELLNNGWNYYSKKVRITQWLKE